MFPRSLKFIHSTAKNKEINPKYPVQCISPIVLYLKSKILVVCTDRAILSLTVICDISSSGKVLRAIASPPESNTGCEKSKKSSQII
jgi:hypothetical protein